MVRRRAEEARAAAAALGLRELEEAVADRRWLPDRRDVDDSDVEMRFFCVAVGRLPKVRRKAVRVRVVTMPNRLPHFQ